MNGSVVIGLSAVVVAIRGTEAVVLSVGAFYLLRKRMQLVPAFGDWSLFQSSADGFEINKRTQPGYSWLTSARG